MKFRATMVLRTPSPIIFPFAAWAVGLGQLVSQDVLIRLHEQRVRLAQSCPWRWTLWGHQDGLWGLPVFYRRNQDNKPQLGAEHWLPLTLLIPCLSSESAVHKERGPGNPCHNARGNFQVSNMPSISMGLVAFMAEHCHKETVISITNCREMCRGLLSPKHLQKEPEKGTKWKAIFPVISRFWYLALVVKE